MAKYSRQKLKLFYLRDFLLRSSDEEHRLTIRDMIAHLASHDISAERKSLYSDLNLLQEYGMDIVRTPKGYYVGSRGFELTASSPPSSSPTKRPPPSSTSWNLWPASMRPSSSTGRSL